MAYIAFNGVVVFILVVSLNLWAKDYGSLEVAAVNSVYDGDTFRADIAGLHPLMGENIGIRVGGVDTPEIRGKCEREKALAKIARDHTATMLSRGKIELRNIKRGKYFRIVADVFIDGESLSDSLIKSALGYPYSGRKKQSWCR